MEQNKTACLAFRTIAYHYPECLSVDAFLLISICCKAAVELFKSELTFAFQKCFQFRQTFDDQTREFRALLQSRVQFPHLVDLPKFARRSQVVTKIVALPSVSHFFELSSSSSFDLEYEENSDDDSTNDDDTEKISYVGQLPDGTIVERKVSKKLASVNLKRPSILQNVRKIDRF